MIKEIIKQMLRAIFGRKKITLKEDDFAVASFDLFDTLIIRNVKRPADVFLIMQEKSGEKDFYNNRIIAEKKARKKKQNGEVSLSDIYDEFQGYTIKQKERMMNLETNIEINVCYPNREMVSLFNSLRCKKIIVSDMYLPESCLTEIIERCGIDAPDQLFVSNEHGASKRNGDLFDLVLNRINATPDEIIHIGDNPISDYFIPLKRGLRAILLKK